MPYARSITLLCFLTVFAQMAFLPSDHVFYTFESMCYATVFAALIFFITLPKNFVMDLLACLFTAFFTQRIIVTYFFPENLSYLNIRWFPPEQFKFALQMLALFVFAILCGYAFVRMISRKLPPTNHSQLFDISAIEVMGRKFPFEKFFEIYAVIAILLLIFQMYLMVQGIGVTAVTFDRKYAIFFRISNFFTSLQFLGFVVLLSGVKGRCRKLAIWLIILIILYCVLRTSKATIIALMTQYILCHYFVKGNLPKRYMRYAFIGLVITTALYAPIITLARYAGIQYATTGTMAGVFDGMPPFKLFVVSGQSFDFLGRLGGFDWLLAAINVGRDAYPWYVSLKGDLLMVLKTLFPGDVLMFIPDYMPVPYLISHLIYGWNLDVHYDQGDLFGFAGMAYVYWGPLVGAVFCFIWISVILFICNSRVNNLYKILILYYFMIDVFMSGGFVSTFCKIYEAFITIGICFAIYSLRNLRISKDITANQNRGFDEGQC